MFRSRSISVGSRGLERSHALSRMALCLSAALGACGGTTHTSPTTTGTAVVEPTVGGESTGGPFVTTERWGAPARRLADGSVISVVGRVRMLSQNGRVTRATRADDFEIASITPMERGVLFVDSEGTAYLATEPLGELRRVASLDGQVETLEGSSGRAVVARWDGEAEDEASVPSGSPTYWTSDGGAYGPLTVPDSTVDAARFFDANHGCVLDTEGRGWATDDGGARFVRVGEGEITTSLGDTAGACEFRGVLATLRRGPDGVVTRIDQTGVGPTCLVVSHGESPRLAVCIDPGASDGYLAFDGLRPTRIARLDAVRIARASIDSDSATFGLALRDGDGLVLTAPCEGSRASTERAVCYVPSLRGTEARTIPLPEGVSPRTVVLRGATLLAPYGETPVSLDLGDGSVTPLPTIEGAQVELVRESRAFHLRERVDTEGGEVRYWVGSDPRALASRTVRGAHLLAFATNGVGVLLRDDGSVAVTDDFGGTFEPVAAERLPPARDAEDGRPFVDCDATTCSLYLHGRRVRVAASASALARADEPSPGALSYLGAYDWMPEIIECEHESESDGEREDSATLDYVPLGVASATIRFGEWVVDFTSDHTPTSGTATIAWSRAGARTRRSSAEFVSRRFPRSDAAQALGQPVRVFHVSDELALVELCRHEDSTACTLALVTPGHAPTPVALEGIVDTSAIGNAHAFTGSAHELILVVGDRRPDRADTLWNVGAFSVDTSAATARRVMPTISRRLEAYGYLEGADPAVLLLPDDGEWVAYSLASGTTRRFAPAERAPLDACTSSPSTRAHLVAPSLDTTSGFATLFAGQVVLTLGVEGTRFCLEGASGTTSPDAASEAPSVGFAVRFAPPRGGATISGEWGSRPARCDVVVEEDP